MTTLAQQALCELNIQVVPAGTSSTTTVEVADYQPNPVMNFDVHLNGKEFVSGSRGRRSLANNAGFSFNRGGPNFSILGPRALRANNVLHTRLTAEHEFDIARGMTDTPGASVPDAELRVWANDFSRYFHQYLALRFDQRPTWELPAIYYQAASAEARSAALQTFVQYFQNPPTGVDAERFRSSFRQWMRRRSSITMPSINGIPESLRGQTVESQLMIDLAAALPAP